MYQPLDIKCDTTISFVWLLPMRTRERLNPGGDWEGLEKKLGDELLHHLRPMGSWWRHQMETFSAQLAFCAGNSPVTGESTAQRPVTRSSDVFFDLPLNKWLSKQWWGWWFETQSRPLWRHCNEYGVLPTSPNGNIFRVTGPLCGEFTGHRWIPVTKTSDAELWCFLWSAPEQRFE